MGLVLPTGETQNTMGLLYEYFFVNAYPVGHSLPGPRTPFPQFFTDMVSRPCLTGHLLPNNSHPPTMCITSHTVLLETLVLACNMN